MNSFKIISDTSCDLSPEVCKKCDVDFVPFHVSFNGSEYYREHVDLSPNEFYEKLIANGTMPKTSLPTVQQYIDAFTPYLEKGQDIICVCISSKFSGSYQSAVNAQSIMKEKYPDSHIFILDSYNATGGQGLVVIELVKMRNDGLDAKTAFEKAEQVKKTSKIFFTIDSLEYLQKGGRIGLAASLAGSLLNIKPILSLLDGELKPHSKIRGRKKALNRVLDIVSEECENNFDDYEYFILHADCYDDGKFLYSSLAERIDSEIIMPILDVGVTIGSHTGPTATGITFIKKYDRL